MKTIRATIPCSEQLLTSPAWGRIFEGLKRRYLTNLWLHTPMSTQWGHDEEGNLYSRNRVTYTVIREELTAHYTIVGPWVCCTRER